MLRLAVITFSPSLTLNIGQRKEDPNRREAKDSAREISEPPAKAPSEPVATAMHRQSRLAHVDGFAVLLIFLAVAVLLIAAAAFIHAVKV